MTTVKKKSGEATLKKNTKAAFKVLPSMLTDGASVSITLGKTVNLGNYESMRLSASVTLPTTSDEVWSALTKAEDLAGEFLNDMVSGIEPEDFSDPGAEPSL